jgi:hypothetical protein
LAWFVVILNKKGTREMKTRLYEAKFVSYRPEPDEFKKAKAKVLPVFKPYVSQPHPQAQRLNEALKK